MNSGWQKGSLSLNPDTATQNSLRLDVNEKGNTYQKFQRTKADVEVDH